MPGADVMMFVAYIFKVLLSLFMDIESHREAKEARGVLCALASPEGVSQCVWR